MVDQTVDLLWHRETELLIALWSEEAVQNDFNTTRNKKLLWDQVSQEWPKEGAQEVLLLLLLLSALITM